MKNRYHAHEFLVSSPGELIRFQYKIPETSGTLTGILPVLSGKLPQTTYDYQTGMLTMEALNRKIHLASLPVVYQSKVPARFAFYSLEEDLSRGQLVNGSYLDNHSNAATFSPYRIKLMFRVMA